jgi:hypothetical protein
MRGSLEIGSLVRLCALLVTAAALLPGAALAQYYEYLATGTINKVQAVDETGADVAGYDYSKFTAAGIVVGGSASYSTVVDSTTPDSTNPPATSQGTYDGAYPSVTIGSVTMAGMTVNNAVAVLDNRVANEDEVPFPHDAFGYGGSMPSTIDGPSWITMNNGTPSERKGSAVILLELPTTNALSGTALPTSLTLASFNFLKTIAVDAWDLETGQRVTVEASVASISIDTNAAAPPPGLPVLGAWSATILVALLLAAGSLLIGGVRRNEV